MKCDVIVLICLSTMDSKAEIDENRKSLRRKYEAQGKKCLDVDFPLGKIPSTLKEAGSVGVYVLSHTKDVVPSELASKLFDQLVVAGAEVRKISIACCRAAASEGPMKLFCSELVKCQTDKVKLPMDLMVSGFTVNVTTFDSQSPFMDEEGKKFQNYEDIKREAAQQNRGVATVKQSWAPRESGEPSFMHFVHEKMGGGATPAFILEAEKLFREKLVEQWRTDGVPFIENKFNPQQKASRKIPDPMNWTWSDFATTHQKEALLYIKSIFWPKFIGLIKTINSSSAAMWTSLDGYVKMKAAMRFDGKSFKQVGLSEYTDNPDMRAALSFVEGTADNKGVTLQFLPQ